jgi:glycosyltransferase involved in cell wall biosynthesis
MRNPRGAGGVSNGPLSLQGFLNMKDIRVLAMLEAVNVSGSAKAVLEFAKEAARGYCGFPKIELSIVTFDRGPGENCLTKAIREIGVPLDVVSERRRFDTNVVRELRSLVVKGRVDLIWTNSVKSHFLVRWAGLNRSRKWVAFHHGYTAVDAKMRIYNHLDRWSLRTADQVLTSSAAFIEELERSNVQRDHIHVQHMPIRPFAPVPEKQKAELRRQLQLDDGTRVLLSVGRLSREKGHADLIHAIPRIVKLTGNAPLRLVIVGEGPERTRIEELCRNLRLTDVVTLTGQQEDINRYYSIADVFLLPSHSEGCPNVLLEAMAAGVPVVATEVGGIPEVVKDGRDAILVKKCDQAGLALTTAQILLDRILRDRLVSSASDIVARKTPEAYFKSIASLFSQSCANGN